MDTNWMDDRTSFGTATIPHYALFIVSRFIQSPREWERREWIGLYLFTPALLLHFHLLPLLLYLLAFLFLIILPFFYFQFLLFFFHLLLQSSSVSSTSNPTRAEYPPSFFSTFFSVSSHSSSSSCFLLTFPISSFFLLFLLLLRLFAKQSRLILSTTNVSSLRRGQPHGAGSSKRKLDS